MCVVTTTIASIITITVTTTTVNNIDAHVSPASFQRISTDLFVYATTLPSHGSTYANCTNSVFSILWDLT